MSKRVFELAKELNTTSKRLMEKLEEINIKVKSHMSLLEEDELNRLYKHIGIVNRSRVDGSDDGNNTDQQEQADSLVRKNIPRIIRKTEIIIHDDDYEHDNQRDKKKNKRGFVRTSSSTDGLMAGLQRGSDNRIPAIRKHKPDAARQTEPAKPAEKKKTEETNVSTSISDSEIIGITQRGDRIRRPVDSILGIKKVSSREDRERQGSAEEQKKEDVTRTGQQDELQNIKEAAQTGKEPNQAVKEAKQEAQLKTEPQEEKAEKQDIKAPAIEDKTEKPKAEIDNEEKTTVVKQKETVSAEAEKSEAHMVTDTKIAQEAGEGIKIQQNPEVLKQQSRPVQQPEVTPAAVRGSDERREAQRQRTADGKAEAAKDNKHEQAQDKKESDKSRDLSNAQFNERASVQTGSRDSQQSRPQQADRQGKGPRPEDRDGRNETGNRGFSRDGQNRGFDRDQNRSFNRDGERGARGGFIRGKDGRGPERGREQGARGKSDDRNRAANKPLVIPKANIIPGLVEEKNNLRGERRSAVTRDLEKDFKREAKKEQPRKDIFKAPVISSLDKGKEKYKKSFVVGHKASVSDMYSDDYVLNEFYEEKERLKKDKKRKEEKHIPPKAVLQEITIPETITVKNLAEALKKTSAEVIKRLMGLGIMATLNQELDYDTAAIVGDEFNVKVHKEIVISDEDILFFDDMPDNEEDLVDRAPVVVVMGHVDHGKTSLLDAIRKTNVVESEAGGITQHIGAYKVNIHGRDITFLDTPGHEAFTAMRARGAQATDIAILVVAADDGVMPQTIEAINHAKAANVSLIVAINKIDKPGANPDRVKQELAEHGVLIEEWGGDVIAVPISAKMGTNIEQLLEMVILTADILELKANPNRQAKGIIIEAKLDKSRGPVATVLVQRGTLRSGDSIISGTTFGRIRAMTDENGRRIEAAGPSTPAEIIGLDEVPEAGDVFYAVSDEKVAKHLVDKRKSEQREKAIGVTRKVSLDDLFSQIQQGDVKELNIIVKADVQGSVEAVKQSIEKLSNDEVKVQIIHGGVGAVNEADVTLASVSNAIIIGFNVRPPANVLEAAKEAEVDIRLYRVIYNAIEDIEKAMKGMLEPTYREVIDGHAEVRQIFKASNIGTIGGSYVTDGKIFRNSEIRVVRNGIVVYEGKLASLKRFKDDVREVAQGYECGILIDRFNDIKEGDVIEAFRMEEVERT